MGHGGRAGPIAWAAGATIALGVAGCGGDDSRQPTAPAQPTARERPIAAAAQDLREGFAERDYARICRRLTRRAQAQAGSAAHGTPTTCVADLESILSRIGAGGGWRHTGDMRTIAFERAGDRGAATVARTAGRSTDLPFARAASGWKLDSFFGTPPSRARAFSSALGRSAFPAADGDAVTATTRDGVPCPPLTEPRLPRVAGGCVIEMSSGVRTLPLTIATAFGEFTLSECFVDARLRVDASGRTWTDALTFRDRPGADQSACGDVYRCPADPADTELDAADLLPLRGRMSATAGGEIVHRVDACLETCIGHYLGPLTMRLRPDGRRWRADFDRAAVGRSGLSIDGSLDVAAGGTALRPATAEEDG